MKNLILIFALIFSVNVMAQSDSNRVYILPEKTAGDYLIQSGNRYVGGFALMLAGSTVTVLSGTIGADAQTPIFMVGCGMSLIGLGLIIDSHVKIKRAGVLLNENGIGVKVKL